MTARVGFDMDGVLADFANAYRKVEEALFGRPSAIEAVAANGDDRPGSNEPRRQHRQRQSRSDTVWAAIRATPDFWITLDPIEEGAVRRLHALTLDRQWEVFFITQRPPTCGDTVQRQTQRWLREQGFEMPSVLPVSAGRAAAMAPLSLHYYVDDNATNCVDLKSASSTQPILIVDDDNAVMTTSARRLGISTAAGIGAALDFLETSRIVPARRPLIQQFAEAVRWK